MDDKDKLDEILHQIALSNCKSLEAKQHLTYERLQRGLQKIRQSRIAKNPALAEYYKKDEIEREEIKKKEEAKDKFWFYFIPSIIFTFIIALVITIILIK